MYKYIAQILYFLSILSLIFVLSHDKLKETNGKTGSIKRQWINNLSSLGLSHKYLPFNFLLFMSLFMRLMFMLFMFMAVYVSSIYVM